MDDLISRQAAIDALEWKWAGKAAIDAIKNLPSVQPKPKTGQWEMKPDPFGFFGEIPVCSEWECTTKMRDKTKFCPHCGADMKGDKDDKQRMAEQSDG